MKKFSINCQFGGTVAPFTIYIGKPQDKHHPLQFQAKWLTDNRGGTIPSEVMEGISKIKEIADRNGVDFEELCAYALQAAIASSSPNPDKTAQQALQEQAPSTQSTPSTPTQS